MRKIIFDPNKECEVCGSHYRVTISKKFAMILCQRHYMQMCNMGKIIPHTFFDKNSYEIKDDIVEIILENRKHEEVARAIIDLEDLEKVLSRRWHYCDWGYAISGSDKPLFMMQNFILDKEGMMDHINRNKLDNRKHNLRFVNQSINSINVGLRVHNTSGVTGICFNKKDSVWVAYLRWQGVNYHLGRSKDKDEAIRWRLIKEKELLGDCSPQKHLFKEYGLE